MAYASNPFDHMLPHDGPYPVVAMPQPFNRAPVFSTMGRGPRGEKGERGFPGEASRKDFETVADMVSEESLEVGDICRTLGFHAAGDGGAAWYQVTDDATANGMDVIALDNGLYAKLQITEAYVTPEMFGAWGDGVHDDSTSIQAIINIGHIIKCSGIYLLEDTVTIPTDSNICIYGGVFTGSSGIFVNGFLKLNDTVIDSLAYNAIVVDAGKIIANNCVFKNQQTTDVNANGTAIFARNGYHVEMHECEAFNIKGIGVTQLVGDGYVDITDCYFHDIDYCAIHGWYSNYATDITQNLDGIIANNVIEDIGLSLSLEKAYDGGNGIYIPFGYNLSIVNNVFRNITQSAIEADAAFISGNAIYNCGCRYSEVEPATGEGIHFTGYKTRAAMICNNIIDGYYGCGIQTVKSLASTVANTPTLLSIIDNVILDNRRASNARSVRLQNTTGSDLNTKIILRDNMSDYPMYIQDYSVEMDNSLTVESRTSKGITHKGTQMSSLAGVYVLNGTVTQGANGTVFQATSSGFQAKLGYVADEGCIIKCSCDNSNAYITVDGASTGYLSTSFCVAMPKKTGDVLLVVPNGETATIKEFSITTTH